MMYSSGKYTFGGIPASQALHWDTYTWQKLGTVVYNITSGKADLRRKGKNDYNELKRQFMLSEWEEYLDKLNYHRKVLGARSIEEILEDIPLTNILDCPPEPVKMPQLHEIKEPVKPVLSTRKQLFKKETIEQMELELF